MMKKFLIPLPLLATLGMALAMPVQAKDLTKYSSSVVEFQMKLAKNGNPLAQFKLGSMYESGQGVKQDDKQAIEWYQKSAAKGHQPAKNRLTFMEIKKSGYKPDSQQQWLNGIKRESDSLDASAMILLADMHTTGVAVEKNPKKALALLKRTSAMGHSEVDLKIEALEREINKSSSKAVAQAKEDKRRQAAAKKRADEEKRRSATDKARQDRQLAERRRLDEQRRQLDAEKRRIEEEKRKLAAQKQQEQSTSKNDDPNCSGAAARFRTTCK